MQNMNCTQVGEHQGHKIAFDKDEGKFLVNFSPELDPGHDDHHEEYYATYADAVAGVTKYVKARARASVKVELKAITDYGRKVTIRGVHMREGHILFDRAEDSRFRRDESVYPVVPWVDQAIRELMQTEKRLEVLQRVLELVEVHRPGMEDSYSIRRARTLEENTKLMLKNYEAAGKVAEKLGGLKQAEEWLGKRQKRDAEKRKKRFTGRARW